MSATLRTSADEQRTESRPPLLTIGLLSATALAYEILLMRLFSIVQWHHFAYMIISLALLGYGASGTFLAFAQSRLLRNYPLALFVNLTLFALAAMPGFLLAQQLPFNPEQLLWDLRQPLTLMLVYMLLMLPFFFAANAIALTLARYRHAIPHVYGFDLVGAGLGALAIVALLFVLFPLAALTAISVLGLVCIAVAAWELQTPKRRKIAFACALMTVPIIWQGTTSQLEVSAYKDLSQTLRVAGTRIIAERSSPLGLLQVVESPQVPLRHAPGMSVTAKREPPAQLGIFSDAGGMSTIVQDTGEPQALSYLDQLTSALPYHLAEPRRVLILGAGGGMDVLQAHRAGAQLIDAVELNPQLVALVRNDYAEFAGGIYNHPGIRAHVAEARGYVLDRDDRYDLIQLALLDSFSASATGLYALSESYLYTTEALQAFTDRLSDNGYLAITRWIKLPPRDTLKILATAIAALEAAGVEAPEKRLALIRGWQTSTLLIKNGDIAASEVKALQVFCKTRAFDVAWYPGIKSGELNRYNILKAPWYHEAAKALLGPEHEAFVERYKFDIAPASDDRPYFFNFFKWSTLPEIWRLRGQGGIPLIEAGYLVLIATLAQALLASALLIVLPLFAIKRAAQPGEAYISRVRVLAYFAAIGLGFLFLEIAFIQKFMLFLHHPLYAAAVVLAGFLVFAGLGSQRAQRYTQHERYQRGVRFAVAGIVAIGGVYLLLLDPLFALFMSWPTAAKVALSVLLIAPLAFCMGMPFPLALSSLGEHAASLIPWAWGVNGCASVLSAVLATLLAVHFGFTVVVLLALLLYLFVVMVFPAPIGSVART
ncbi:MAG: SAM-dependent methyltransferase [Pseudomonadota bacterium]|nr:MAG: SAM-dependent methyltransferase [Pseudomonadota bacterium]